MTVLPPDQVSARIKAARLLRGVTQDELADRLAEAGLTWRLAGELERGEAPLLALHRVALATALGLPERWFTAPIDELCFDPPEECIAARLDQIRDELARLSERIESR